MEVRKFGLGGTLADGSLRAWLVGAVAVTSEPRKGAPPKVKIPPSAATVQ